MIQKFEQKTNARIRMKFGMMIVFKAVKKDKIYMVPSPKSLISAKNRS